MQKILFSISECDFDEIDPSINALIHDGAFDTSFELTWTHQFLPRIGESVNLTQIVFSLIENDKNLNEWFKSMETLGGDLLLLALCDTKVIGIVYHADLIQIDLQFE